MNFSVTKSGKVLDKSLYHWDEKTKTFSSNEDRLVLDFTGIDGVTFNTGSYCTFDTGSDCTFNTNSHCTFNTGSDCTFKTGFGCIFNTGSDCTFDTGSDCVVVRRDIYEVIEIPEDTKIKLNGYEEKGYTVIPETHVITIDGKEIELSEDSFNNLKTQLTGE